MEPGEIFRELFANREVAIGQIASKEAEYAEPSFPIPSLIQEQLSAQGIERLFTHQAQAYDAYKRKEDSIVVTGTSSGKTLCYALPAMEACLSEPAARVLFLFPTKALAQDQLGRIQSLVQPLGFQAATYDGDTPKNQRGVIRREAHILLSNPDMLHIGILPGHELWVKFLKSLRLIVIDEAHTYRGVWGGHVAWILRRLLRLCEWHGSVPRIIATSATIANPIEHLSALTGRPGTLIDQDGAPQGNKTIFLIPPPNPEEANPASPNVVSAKLLADLAKNSVKTLAFCRSRVGTELVLKTAQDFLKKGDSNPKIIDSYRGGYTPAERRKIEEKLFSGKISGLTCTNAMELGVDVGGLDAVILNGYPGRLSSFWQQVGRAGRSGRDGFGVLIAHADPLEQILTHEPDRLLKRGVEPVVASVNNPFVATAQIKCAAYERPLDPGEVHGWGFAAVDATEDLVDADEIRPSAGKLFYPSHDAPAPKVNIRGSHGNSVKLIVDGDVLGEMEEWRAHQNAHKGAVYLHRGETYEVQSLDLRQRAALLTQTNADYFTRPVVSTNVEPQLVIASDDSKGIAVSSVAVKVVTQVTAFRKVQTVGQAMLGEEPLDLTERSFETTAVRFDFDHRWIVPGDPEGVAALHTLEHLLTSLAPLFAGCDRNDISSSWNSMMPDTLQPAIFILDDAPGGLGLTEMLRKRVPEWVDAAHELISQCSCRDGCPICILSPNCPSGNEPLSKSAAKLLISRMSSVLGR
ncbi:MAG: DEAD/DEAH box helicase [Fimbriimonadaceae bacterium]